MRVFVYLDTGRCIEAAKRSVSDEDVHAVVQEKLGWLRGVLTSGLFAVPTAKGWVVIPVSRLESIDVQEEGETLD